MLLGNTLRKSIFPNCCRSQPAPPPAPTTASLLRTAAAAHPPPQPAPPPPASLPRLPTRPVPPRVATLGSPSSGQPQQPQQVVLRIGPDGRPVQMRAPLPQVVRVKGSNTVQQLPSSQSQGLGARVLESSHMAVWLHLWLATAQADSRNVRKKS